MPKSIRNRPLLEFELNPDMIGEGLTQSEMQCWDNCPEKWYLGYNLKLTKKDKMTWATIYGSWFHAALEEFYSSKGKRWSWTPIFEQKRKQFLNVKQLADLEYYQGLGQIQMEVYSSRYKHDPKFWKILAIEEIFDLEFEGVRLKGMIDLLIYSEQLKGYYIIDHKTTSRLTEDVIDGWEFRLQFMFYCWAARKLWGNKYPIKGFIVNAIKKPALKRGVNDSTQSFLERIRLDMYARDEEYFYRNPKLLKKGDMDRFESTILRPKLERVRMIMDPKIPDSIKSFLVRNKNTDYCTKYNGHPCEFLDVCKHGMALERRNYLVRENKHEELAEEPS